MTALPDPTVQTPADPTQQFAAPSPPPPPPPPSTAAGTTDDGPRLNELRAEDPKRNPITYLALAIAVLALLLSMIALTRDPGPDQVDVGGKRCIVDRIDGNEADTLFCQT